MASTVDPAALDGFRRRLEARRDELARLIAQGHESDAPVAPDRAIGRLTRQDALQQQAMAAALVRRYAHELRRVEGALEALEAGTYGLCQRCDEPIALARLQAMPYAALCVRCADRPGRPR
jgi:DnaK suppressor protein